MISIETRTNLIRIGDVALFVIGALSGGLLVVSVLNPEEFGAYNVVSGLVFTLSVSLFLVLRMNPDSIRARQSDTILKIASNTLACFQEGYNAKTCQKVCELLLPATAAQAVAMTDREHITGYVGLDEQYNPGGANIRTKATRETLEDGQLRVLGSSEEIGFPTASSINAGIIVPLRRGSSIIGTLKFYYKRPRSITETQVALAEGLGELLSTQIAAVEMEEQAKLATTMELKALQAQINPHFLFNTINTIASLVRTDPERARVLLREFAVFYRRTLENSDDLIELSREIEQTSRYFMFEKARFGDDRLEFVVDVEEGLEDLPVPAFMVQPLVENAVRHAMPQEGKLVVTISAHSDGDDAYVTVSDNGIGMDAEQSDGLFKQGASKGLGIAMKNIQERLIGYFGPESRMLVDSEPGKGTSITMFMKGAWADE